MKRHTNPWRRLAMLAALAIAAAAPLALADSDSGSKPTWTLATADFAEQQGLTVNTWNIADGLSATSESGKLVKVDCRNILSLMSSRPKSAAVGGGASWRMTLRNGDVLYGEPTAISGQSIEFKMVEIGPILVPLKIVAGISLVKANAPKVPGTGAGPIVETPAVADADVVYLATGDVLKGIILDINPQRVQLSVGTTNPVTSDILMSSIDHLTLGGMTVPRTVPPLSVRISLVSGSVLTLPLDAKDNSFAWSINDLTFKDLCGKERKATADLIADIDVIGGRVVYLTELDPSKDEQTTFMGTKWPTQIDRNVVGQPLKVGKVTFARGLGVHTRSDITYDIGGNFDTLKFRVGMDDSAAAQGSADVSVLLDGKVIWESKGLKTVGTPFDGDKGNGQISPELSLPIKGGKTLELRAVPAFGAGKVDVLGRVDWLNVALVRP